MLSLVFIGRVPGSVAAPQVRRARELARLPQLAAAFAAGRVSAAHVDVVCLTTRNPRVAEFVTDETDRWFTEHACDTAMSFDAFRQLLKAWEFLVDGDGAHDRSERNHANRHGHARQLFDGSVVLDGRFGEFDGAMIMAVLQAEERRLFDQDWAEAKAIHGDAATLEQLARTPAQRRSDAIVAIFRRAATIDPADGARVQPEPLVDGGQHEWSKGGRTDAANGRARCGFHNRLRNLGFRVTEDEEGRPSFFRPDGTPITAPV